jgi:hypothetical protein
LIEDYHTPFFTIEGEVSGDHLGLKEISVGDLNGDLISDLIISTPFAQNKRGRVYLVLGPHKPNPVPLQFTNIENLITIDGTKKYSQVGWNTSFLGDVDGDKFSDFAISSRMYNKKQSGTLHLIFSDNSLFDQPICYNIEDVKHNTRHINGDLNFESDFAYSIVGLEDINGDTKNDFAVLERKVHETTKSDVHIYHGSSWIQWESYKPDTTIKMNYEIGEMGSSIFRNFKARQILNVGDIDNDGQNDLALFSSTSKYNSLSKGDGMILIHTNLNSSLSRDAYLDASVILNNPISSGISSSFGQSLAVGRLNDDEFLDFIVGGKSIGTSNQGGVYIYYGPLQGEYDSAHGFVQSMSKNSRLGTNVELYSHENNQYMLFNTSFVDATKTPAKLYQIDHLTIPVDK